MSVKQTDKPGIDQDNGEISLTGEVLEWPSQSPESEGAEDTDDAEADLEDTVDVFRRQRSPKALAAIALTIMVVVLGALVGWLGVHLHESQQTAQQRAEFLQAARQGAINLTSVDWQNVDSDVKRIVDSATGPFFEDFSQRAQPFIDVVRQVQSKTTGTVSMAGLESMSGDQARALVAVTVETTNAGEPEPTSKAWRMRIDVQREGNDVKVANVEFVP
ncbi:hypothetical protein MN2019_23950 [Mycolicibacterium neoaurum]|uniref:hypothetical protein n=1 Tax=Mycolicibacterium neoaurum TaxID=1795 RepID=UPI001BD022F7|nr:hypothetical protein [Mycolicibacterium neoaurum]QVI27232.1 hypothetical protein MN2019_23950 [Mycolicibacterium neoaurum]